MIARRVWVIYSLPFLLLVVATPTPLSTFIIPFLSAREGQSVSSWFGRQSRLGYEGNVARVWTVKSLNEHEGNSSTLLLLGKVSKAGAKKVDWIRKVASALHGAPGFTWSPSPVSSYTLGPLA